MSNYLNGINRCLLASKDIDESFKALLFKILKVYNIICDSHDWDYEFHYVDDILNNQNGFSEITGTIIREYNINKWQEKVIFQALEYDFIRPNEVEKASEIINKFNSEDDFFYKCSNSEIKLENTLANASQI